MGTLVSHNQHYTAGPGELNVIIEAQVYIKDEEEKRKMVGDINLAWERLEKAEHECELVLREELTRQEKLEQLVARVNRKADMRKTWLSENRRLVL